MYCVRCKSKTPTSLQNVLTKNNRSILTGICVACGCKKSMFITTKAGKGIVNSILNSGYLPKLHLPGHSYTKRKLRERLLDQSKPINKLNSTTWRITYFKTLKIATCLIRNSKTKHVKYNTIPIVPF